MNRCILALTLGALLALSCSDDTEAPGQDTGVAPDSGVDDGPVTGKDKGTTTDASDSGSTSDTTKNCTTCAKGFKCGTSGKCELNPTGMWVPTVTKGFISAKRPDGKDWDALGGKPDPIVCLTIAGDRTCTDAAKDTLKPTWNKAFPAASATALQSAVKVEFADLDISAHDLICKISNVVVTLGDFKAGGFSVTCGTPPYAGFDITLKAQ